MYNKYSHNLLFGKEWIMKLKQQNNKVTALYCRFSRDDLTKGDSMSISHQKEMLSHYAQENGFINTDFYIDDGYSGTNFKRPDFQRLVEDAENGKIGTVIVKDLSRLGREYLQTGYYTEMFFPQYNVRFIAINDNVDSDEGDNDFAPFKNLINEFYAKDISNKIKSALRTKALKGELVTGATPYGYSKDENDRTRLVPNENAEYVRMMYRWALEGYSCNEIATKMTRLGVLIPKAAYYTQIGKTDSEYFPKYPHCWQKGTVRSILLNPVYTGNMTALKYKSKSFKDKTLIERPEEERIVTPNTHEALVSQADYDTVLSRLSVKCRDRVESPENIFRGLVMCPDCGNRHGFKRRIERKTSKGCFVCSTNIHYGKTYCSTHYITIEQLSEVVLADIQRHASLAAENVSKYVDILTSTAESADSGKKSALKKELDRQRKRISELETLLQKIYEDKVFGVISEERYFSMSEKMETELSELKQSVKDTADKMSDADKAEKNARDFAGLISKYVNITELDYDLIHTLIEKIYVHERVIADGRANVRVDIYYRFIGLTDNGNPTVLNRSLGIFETDTSKD